MNGWVAYGCAFGLGLGAAIICAFAVDALFSALASPTDEPGASFSMMIAGFGLSIILPLLAGFAVFAISYGALSGYQFGLLGWIFGPLATLIIGFTAFVSLTHSNMELETVSAAIVTSVILFVAGRLLLWGAGSA